MSVIVNGDTLVESDECIIVSFPRSDQRDHGGLWDREEVAEGGEGLVRRRDVTDNLRGSRSDGDG